MAARLIRCGTSQAIYYAPPAERPVRAVRRPKADQEPVRLRSPFHMASSRSAVLNFRVVAQLPGGATALVCLGATREDAAAGARARRRQLPAGTLRLQLEQWVGAAGKGSWQWTRWPGSEVALPPAERAKRLSWRKSRRAV